MIFAEIDDLSFVTVQVYRPPNLPVTVRLWLYKASTALLSIVEVALMRLRESLIQITLVAGPPVETQVRVNNSVRFELRVNAIFVGILTTPTNANYVYLTYLSNYRDSPFPLL